jgi:hypothetical protein
MIFISATFTHTDSISLHTVIINITTLDDNYNDNTVNNYHIFIFIVCNNGSSICYKFDTVEK